MTTLQTVSGISARIFDLPNRPPFMVAADLADTYQTTPKRINEAVKRNPERFPEDFFFILTEAEDAHLRSQNATTNMARALPSAFTHAGALALSGVLKTTVAAEVSVIVHRAFAAMEQRALQEVRDLLAKLRMEASFNRHRLRVVHLAAAGFNFEKIWQQGSLSRPKLAWVIRECVILGLIPQAPDGTPKDYTGAVTQIDLIKAKGIRQPDLFGEG